MISTIFGDFANTTDFAFCMARESKVRMDEASLASAAREIELQLQIKVCPEHALPIKSNLKDKFMRIVYNHKPLNHKPLN